MIEVFGPPAVEFDRPVIPDGLRREAALERREIDERLEGRAGLTPSRNRPVELVFRIVAAADQRHRDERALLDAEFLALLRELVEHGLFGRRLETGIDRRLDDDILIDQ